MDQTMSADLSRRLQEELREIRARKQRAQQKREEAQRQEERESEAEAHVRGLLNYYGIEPDEEGRSKLESPQSAERSFYNGEDKAQAAKGDTEPSDPRQRLPRGFLETAIMNNFRRKERFLHVNEHLKLTNEQIEERWPNQPHLKADRRGLNRPLRRLFEQGELIRTRYGGSHNYIFHGLPRFVMDLIGEPTFASDRYKPDPSRLGSMEGPPEFLVPQPVKEAENRQQR